MLTFIKYSLLDSRVLFDFMTKLFYKMEMVLKVAARIIFLNEIILYLNDFFFKVIIFIQ